jgi:hypothetical protein
MDNKGRKDLIDEQETQSYSIQHRTFSWQNTRVAVSDVASSQCSAYLHAGQSGLVFDGASEDIARGIVTVIRCVQGRMFHFN